MTLAGVGVRPDVSRAGIGACDPRRRGRLRSGIYFPRSTTPLPGLLPWRTASSARRPKPVALFDEHRAKGAA